MTKPAVLPAHVDVVEVEIDAMDLAEWESGQQTPLASDKNLAELVRRTAELPVPPVPNDEPTSSSPAHGRPRRRTATLVPARMLPARPSAPPPVPRSTVTGSAPKPAPAQQAAAALLAAPATETAGAPVATTSGTSEIDFSLPVTAVGEPAKAPRPPVPPAATEFAEPSHVGPGYGSSPVGGVEPNTAWPPRPIPAGMSSSFDRRPASDGMPRATGHEVDGTDRLPVVRVRRRLGWIAGAVGIILLGAIVAAALLRAPEPGRAPSPSEDRTAGSARPASGAVVGTATSSAVPGATAGRPVARATPATPDASAARGATTGFDPPVAAPEPATPAPEARPVRHVAKRFAGKKLVVDYTARPGDPPPPTLEAQSEEDPAVGRARTAYAAGNQKLFAGDLDGAIRAYHQALEIYPGYVGGYRGLGLAYAQAGDNARALEALRTYVAAVPNARDAALIKKRIAHLQGE